MTDKKDRMTIFPEQRSGEAGEPAAAAERSAKRPGQNRATPLGKEGQAQAREFREDRDRQTLGGKMGRSER